jgi:hypothetical protein
MPEGISANELYAWRRNRTVAGREQLLGNAQERVRTKALAETAPPPSPGLAESDAVAGAKSAAARTRRKARAGHAGRVTTGPGNTPTTAGGVPRSLIGY